MEVFESTLVDYFSRSFLKRVINDAICFSDTSMYSVVHKGFESVSVPFSVVCSLVFKFKGFNCKYRTGNGLKQYTTENMSVHKKYLVKK